MQSPWSTDEDVPHALIQRIDTAGTTTSWEVVSDAGSLERFDSDGKFASIHWMNGTNVNIARSPGAFSLNDEFGRSLTLALDSKGRIASMKDPAGGLYQYAYDGGTGPSNANNLTSVSFPDGSRKKYWYGEPEHTGGANLPNALTGISDELDRRFATYEFNASGHAVRETLGGGVDNYQLAFGTDNTDVVGPELPHEFRLPT